MAPEHRTLLQALRVHQVELELQNEQLRSVERDLELQNERLRSAQQELELSRAQYRELFELAPAGYVSLDTAGVIGRANRAAEALLGAAHGGLLDKSLAEFTEGGDLRSLRAHLRAAAHGQHACQIRLRRLDGSGADALTESRPAPGGGYLTVLRDVSERKRTEQALCLANQQLVERTLELASQKDALEDACRARAASDAERNELAERLRDAERLESLGLLASGIAHDFNDILAGVMANADRLLQNTPELEEATRDGLISIRHAARSAADLTRQLLVFAGRGAIALQPIPLDRLIEATLRLLRVAAPEGIELHAELNAKEHWILADAGQVQQVVSTLVSNALESLTGSTGRVTVRTQIQQLDARALARFPHVSDARPGRFVVLEVEDTGAGMDSVELSRIFEPFFSSKFAGPGLGLASVQGIVRSHHAALRVHSVPGRGSRFEIAWPLAESPA
jgi:PAS domain S-box-containing protein